MSNRIPIKDFYYRKFIFIRTFKLRIYIIVSFILVLTALIFFPPIVGGILFIVLLLFSTLFLIKKRYAGAVSYSSVVYHRHFFDKEKTNDLIPVPIRNVDLLNYIKNKPNSNVLICGTSGQGKSRLMRYLLYISTDRKIIFSYKENDDYLKMGYPILNIENDLPDPFSDSESFVSAFLITYPISNMGIISQYIPIILREMSKISHDWNDFLSNLEIKLKSSKDQIQRSAYLFIIEHSKSIISKNYTKNIEFGNETMVLDFSRLNESSKTFYTELILRLLWKKLTLERKNITICIDEAHRLLFNFERYQSIYVEMSREIRAFGKLWTSTQNYSDVPSYVRNQFATQFSFNSSIKEDLDQLGAVDPKLKWAVSNMPMHVFTDVRYPWNFKVIPEFFINWYPLDFDQYRNKIHLINYNLEIEKILKSEVLTFEQIVLVIKSNYKIDEKVIEINAKNAIYSLIKEKRIKKILYTNKYVYFSKSLTSENLSIFHKFMENEIVSLLTEMNIKVEAVATKGNNLPDIISEKFVIEIETGLKHDTKDLEKRIENGSKPTIIVIPNSKLYKKYKKIKNAYILEISNLKDFIEKHFV
jgi:energy-coupling factor transporter ATP-binding protein EcfA2